MSKAENRLGYLDDEYLNLYKTGIVLAMDRIGGDDCSVQQVVVELQSNALFLFRHEVDWLMSKMAENSDNIVVSRTVGFLVYYKIIE